MRAKNFNTQPNALRIGVSSLLLGYFILPPAALWANPAGETVTHGSATFDRNGNSLVIHQNSDKLITQWNSFSIAQGEKTQFVQPSKNSAALNRVVGGSRSIIDGELSANGKVVLINPAGVTVGPTGVVNVNSFTASTQDITDQEFIGGGELLYKGASQESIENYGKVNAVGGDAIIIAKTIKNHGEINAPNGTAALAAGTEVLVKPVGEERVSIRPGSARGGTVEQGVNGRVQAASAEIKAKGNPYALAINLDGLVDVKGAGSVKPRIKVQADGGDIKVAQTGKLKARTETGAGGEVAVLAVASQELVSVPAGNVEIAGTVDANGDTGAGGKIDITGSDLSLAPGSLVSANGSTTGGSVNLLGADNLHLDGTVAATGGTEAGGQIKMRGSVIDLGETAVADASSTEAGGGKITVGGEFQGGIDPSVNADTVKVAPGAQLNANAGTNGDGGTIIVWAEQNTFFYGNLSATGGSVSGNGGFAEVSGKQFLAFDGVANLGSTNGELGTLLLDPNDIEIIAGAGGALPSNPYAPGTTSTITWGSINATAGNVTIQTTAGGIGGNGDITIIDSGIWTHLNSTLTLISFRDININPGVIVKASSTVDNTASFDFQAGRNFTMTGATLMTANYSNSGSVNGGNIRIQSGLNGGGDILITGSTLAARGGTTSGGNIYLEAHSGNITITNNATYANTIILAGGERNESGGQLHGNIFNTTGDLTLRAMNGQISILQVEDVNSRIYIDKAAYDAKLLAGITPTFFTIGTKGGNLTIETGASDATFSLDRDITIDLLTADVLKYGVNDLNKVTIKSGRDLRLNGDTLSGKSLVGSAGARGDLKVEVARDLVMTQSAALRTAGYSIMDIEVGRDLVMSGGTTQGFMPEGIQISDATTGSYIGGGDPNSGGLLFLDVEGDLRMRDASAIAWFHFQEINVEGDVTFLTNTSISNVGATNASGQIVLNLLHTLPGYGAAQAGIYLNVGGSLTSNGSNRVESVYAGNVSIIAQGDISFTGTGTAWDKQSYIRTQNVNGYPLGSFASADVLVQSINGGVFLDLVTLVGAANGGTPSPGGVGGDVTVRGSGAGNAGDVVFRNVTTSTYTSPLGTPGHDAHINLISDHGDVRFAGDFNSFTMRESSGTSGSPAVFDSLGGLLNVEAKEGSIHHEAGGFTTDVSNASFVAQDITFDGDQIYIGVRSGDLLMQSTVGDITISPMATGATGSVTSVINNIGYGSATGGLGLRLISNRDVILKPREFSPTKQGDLLITATSGNARPILIQANRNVIIGQDGSWSNVAIRGGAITSGATAGVGIQALNGTVDVKNGIAISQANYIAGIGGASVSIYGKNGIRFNDFASAVIGSSVQSSGGGKISMVSDFGDILLSRVITDSGQVSLSAGAVAGGFGNILDSFSYQMIAGVRTLVGRTMSNINQGNIVSTSGAVTLYARNSVGLNNSATGAINTTADIKLELDAPANVSAKSEGTGANEGVYLSAWKDLLIGTSGNTSVTANGDIILKSIGNVYVNGNVVASGAGRTVGIRSNSANLRNGDFIDQNLPGNLSGDIIIAGGIQTNNGSVVLETGNGLLPPIAGVSAVNILKASKNDIQYNLDSTQSISTGSGEIYMRANRNISVGRLVTTSGNVTLIAGSVNAFGADGRPTLVAGLPNVAAGKGQIRDVFQKELRDASDQASGEASANIVVTGALAGFTSVILVAGKSVGLVANNQDIDLALHKDTTLKVFGKGTDSTISATTSDGVFLSFLGDYTTDSSTAIIQSGSNLGISVTGNLTVAPSGLLTTANNGNIWLTAYGTYSASPGGAGFLNINANVTADGDGNINIFASRKVLVNSNVTSTSGDISIIGAGRTNDSLVSEVYGVEVTSNATVSTGAVGANVGTIHLAALGSADASNAVLSTDPNFGKILVGGVEVYGQGQATVPAGGTYYVGVTYGGEVVYDTIAGSPTGAVTVVSGNATTQDIAELQNATGSLPYIIDSLGRIIITTSATNTLTSTQDVDVSSVTISGATTTVVGNGTSQAVTDAGSVMATLSGNGTGTTNWAGIPPTGYEFSLSSTGNATVANTDTNGTHDMTLNHTNGSLVVGAVTTSGTGTNATLTTSSGTAAAIATASNGTLTNTSYTASGSNATITAGQGTFVAGTSGTVVASGTVSATIADGTGNTVVGTNSGLTAALDASSNMSLTTTATLGTASVNASGAGEVTFSNTNTTVFDPNATTNVVSFGAGTSTLGIENGSTTNLGSVNVSTALAGSDSATLNLVTAYTSADLTTLASSGTTGKIIVNLGSTTGQAYEANAAAQGNFDIDAGIELNFTAAGLSTTSQVAGGLNPTAAYAGGFTGNSVGASFNNVSVSAPDIGTATATIGAGSGLQSTAGSGASLLLNAGGNITVDGPGGTTVALSTSNTPDLTQGAGALWAPTGNPGEYQYVGATLQLSGNVLIKTSAVQVRLNDTAVIDKANPAANVGTLIYSDTTGYSITSLKVSGSQTTGTVNVMDNVNVIGATVGVTGGKASVSNVSIASVNYTDVKLNAASYTVGNASASFQNIGLTGVATSLSSSQSVTSTLASASVSGGTSTFSNTVKTNSGNTVNMVATNAAVVDPISGNVTSGGMFLNPGGSLVQMNGIEAPTTGLNASSLKVADGATVRTQGGDIYASGFKDAEIGTLNAKGSAAVAGDIFLEATTGSVKSLNASDPSKVNVIATSATVNAGIGLYGNSPTAGAIGGVGADAIKLDVSDLNFSAGTGGANFRMDKGRSLNVAGKSLGQVSILNDHDIRVTETEKITFDDGTGIRLDNRFWVPKFVAATQVGINAGSQTVFLRATDDQGGGNIVSDNGGRVTGGNVYLDAEKAIGEGVSDRLLTDGSDIWFRAANGSAFISELNAASVAGTALANGSEIDIKTEQAGNLTITTEGGPAINHPIDGTNQPTINGLTAQTDVTLDSFQGGVRVHQNITAQTGDVLITANSSNANSGNTTDYGVEIGGGSPVVSAVIQAGGAGNGQSVTIISNFGDIWRSNAGTGLVRAQDAHFVTTGTGSVGWRNGSVANTNLLTQAENITFDSVQRVNIRNVQGNNPTGFLWGNVTVAGAAAGDVIFQNQSGQLTVGELTNTLGTVQTGIVTSGSGAVNGYDITIDNVGSGLAGGASTNVLIAEQISANRVANDPTSGDNAFILARTGSILRSGGTDAIVTGDRIQLISGTAASNTIGTTASRILTDGNEIIFDSGSNAIITEEDATLLAGRTRNAGNIDVISNAAADNAVPATITVTELTSTAFGGHAATQYYGVNADTTGDINLEARGNQSDVVFEASARSGSGNINVAAGHDMVDAITGDIMDGLDSSSNLLNIVTGGNGGDTANVTIQAGRNIGGKGTNTIDVAAGGTITTHSDGAAVGDGTYLSVLGDANIGNNAIITSDRNIDVSTFERTAVVNGLGAQEGDITVSTLMANANDGYTRLNARDDIFLNVSSGNVAIDRGATGDIVLQARTGGITHTAGLSRLQGQSLHIEAAEDAGVNGLGALQTTVSSLTFSTQEDLVVSEANQLVLSGNSANGNVTVTSGGTMGIDDLTVYRAWDIAAADDDINNTTNPVQAAYTGGNSGVRVNQTNGVVTLTSTGGAIADISPTEANNVTGNRAILNAATNVGTGAMGANDDIETEVAILQVNVISGTANIRELDSVTVGSSTVGDDFRINSGGFIYQEAGSVIAVTDEVELDTTRDTSIGHATVHSTGDLEILDSEVNGNFTVQTTGDTTVTGRLTVAGNLALGIGSVDIDSTGNIVGGSFTSGGTFVVDGTGTVTVYGSTNVSTLGTGVTAANAPTLTYDLGTQTLKITASGASQEFNLSVVLDASGAFLNQYETVNGVTINTVQVDLRGNTGSHLANTTPTDDAIVWTESGNSMSKLMVRTGAAVDTTVIAGTLQDYDLGQTGSVDIGTRDLTINAAVGSNFGGSSAINGGNGSYVELGNGANQFGEVHVNEAWNTRIYENGTLDLTQSVIHGNLRAQSMNGNLNVNDLQVDGSSAVVAVGTNADVNFTGDVTFGGHALVAAGEDIGINNGVTVTGNGLMAFIVDENAGTTAGDGWFRNFGTIQTNDADERIVIYAVSGPSHQAGFSNGLADQIVFGNIVDGSGTDLTGAMQNWKGVGGNTLNDKYNTSYRGGGNFHAASWNDYEAGEGLFGGPAVWYKDLVAEIPILVTDRPGTAFSSFIYNLEDEAVNTSDYGNFSDLERHSEEYDENFYTQKSFGIYYQRAAFREAAKAWAPDPVNILNGHFNDQNYYIQGKSNMRSYRSDRFHSEYVKYP